MSTKQERLEVLAREGMELLRQSGFYDRKRGRIDAQFALEAAADIAATDRRERIAQALKAVMKAGPKIDAQEAAQRVLSYDQSLLPAGPPSGERLRAFVREVRDVAKSVGVTLSEPKEVPLPSIAMAIGAGGASQERIRQVVNEQLRNAGAGRFRG